MRGRRERWSKAAGVATVALILILVGAVVAQDPPPPPVPAKEAPKPKDKDKDAKEAKDANKGKAAAPKKGLRLRAPAREPVKAARRAVDPLANPAGVDPAAVAPGQPLPPPGTFRYRFKIVAGEAEPLAAAYYPSKLGSTAPAVIMVHERDRSSKDFEESIDDLKKLSIAEHLQKQGYAVMLIDLRGHGANTRRALQRAEWAAVPGDVQVAYLALVDRHNWGELNLAKLGVVAIGEGANVAAAWAAGGGAVSSEGRTSDLGALILLSPMNDAVSQGLRAGPLLTAMAARVPIDLLVGERDASSFELVDSIKTVIKRYRSNLVEIFPSALHGQNLLRREPNLTASITKYLDERIKARADEWEGRYLLTPVSYVDIKVIPNPVRADPAAATKKAAQ